MVMVVLDRFSGGNDPEGWILRAEQYFTCLGFSKKDWLPLPYFYLDGEALTWFTWLHRNKQFVNWKHFTEKMLMRFPKRTFTASASMIDTSRAYFNCGRYATFVPPMTSAFAIVDLSHVTLSSDLEDGFISGNTDTAHMLEKLPEKYTNVDCLALITGSNIEFATLEVVGTPQIGNAKSVEADLLEEPSSITEGQVFDEISHTTVSSDISEPIDRFYEDVSIQTKVPPSVLNDMKGSNDVDEENSLDNVALFDKSPQRDASGTLAPFSTEGPMMSNTRLRITEVYPIATGVPLLVPLVGCEVMLSNKNLEQDMPTRYVVPNAIGSGSPKWKTDLETKDLSIDKYFLENESSISTSAMHYVRLLPAAKNGKSLGGFSGQNILSQFPFVPAVNFLMLIVIVSAIVVDLCVWDPGIGFGLMALTGYIENVEELLSLKCTDKFLLITYSNCMSRVWDPGQLGSLWEVKILTSVSKEKAVHSAGYTLYGVIEIVELDARHRLHHGLEFYRKSERTWLQLVVINSSGERVGGRRAFTSIAQYFEVNNSRFDESEHVTKYHLYHISSALGLPLDPNSNLGEILSISLSDTTTYILVTYGNILFDRKGIDAKEEWNEKGILVPISHLSEVLLENMIKILNVAANSASTSFGDIIRCIAFWICLTWAANRVSSLLLTNLTVPGDAHAYSNLEGKALIGVGSIVMNGPRLVIPKTAQYHIKELCVGSRLISSTF
ncbi:hypothetical protein KY284_030264 [Solanum tuberosum]|nr:hypothetical protein KY284_030264 [Solanum tuberosum]